jgi:hypothetical protein
MVHYYLRHVSKCPCRCAGEHVKRIGLEKYRFLYYFHVNDMDMKRHI